MYIHKILIKGLVQGVGFRPYVYNLAHMFNLKGYINNDDIGVNIILNNDIKEINVFLEYLKNNLPSLARIDDIKIIKEISTLTYTSFDITKSKYGKNKESIILADMSICSDCIDDVNNKDSHRFNYALTNCTNCGPRYSIIKTSPYDRVNTSMSNFSLCDTCEKEYTDPANRRYHAQPLSCERCGPEIFLYDENKVLLSKNINAINEIASKINEGFIVALKAMGGFHLVCDSTNDKTIQKLREIKNRPSKPFAVMFKDIKNLESFISLSSFEKKTIESNKKPIMLIQKKDSQKSELSPYLAPNINTLGVFLPSSALQVLLFKKLNNPIICTSANLKGESIIHNKENMFLKLPYVFSYLLDFNREILNANDDSIVQSVNDEIQILRQARAYAPITLKVKKKFSKKILALGANQKSTISMAINNNIITSPYIGDLNSLDSLEFFKRTIKTFEDFYDFKAQVIICDKHPLYESTKLAKELRSDNIDLIQIQHHYAHVLACMAEYSLEKDHLCFVFDGTGYGDDGNIWGGEVFIANNRTYKRVYNFKNFKLLGADKAVKIPKRIALSLLFDIYTLDEVLNMNKAFLKEFTQKEIKTFYLMHSKSLNSPLCSSLGRIFDAISSFANILHIQSYEGQSGLLIEKYYDKRIKESFKYELINNEIDLSFLIKEILLLEDKKIICSMFINTIVNIIIDISNKYKNLDIILTGGVFQNKTLLELVSKKLNSLDKKFYYQKSTAINDSSISIGQIYSQL